MRPIYPGIKFLQYIHKMKNIVFILILATASLITQQHVDVEIDGRDFPTSLFLVTVAFVAGSLDGFAIWNFRRT